MLVLGKISYRESIIDSNNSLLYININTGHINQLNNNIIKFSVRYRARSVIKDYR